MHLLKSAQDRHFCPWPLFRLRTTISATTIISLQDLVRTLDYVLPIYGNHLYSYVLIFIYFECNQSFIYVDFFVYDDCRNGSRNALRYKQIESGSPETSRGSLEIDVYVTVFP